MCHYNTKLRMHVLYNLPIPKFDDRFARQNRFELPPEFPLASPYSGIVHHLSGPNGYAHTQILQETIQIGR